MRTVCLRFDSRDVRKTVEVAVVRIEFLPGERRQGRVIRVNEIDVVLCITIQRVQPEGEVGALDARGVEYRGDLARDLPGIQPVK